MGYILKMRKPYSAVLPPTEGGRTKPGGLKAKRISAMLSGMTVFPRDREKKGAILGGIGSGRGAGGGGTRLGWSMGARRVVVGSGRGIVAGGQEELKSFEFCAFNLLHIVQRAKRGKKKKFEITKPEKDRAQTLGRQHRRLVE